MKKRIKYIIFFFLIFTTLYISATAHPGSLDENGGHYNRKTGEYHYHEGIHTEGTGSSGSSSSSTYYKEGYKEGYVAGYDEASAENENSYDSGYDVGWDKGYDEGYADAEYEYEDSNLPLWIFGCIILTPLGLAFLILVLRSIYEAIRKKFPKTLLSEYEKQLSQYSEQKAAEIKALNAISESIQKTGDFKTFKFIPEEYEIGEDGLPKEKGAERWGDTFTAYMIRKNGRSIHKIPDCQENMILSPIHLYWAHKLYPRSNFCKRCWNNHPKLEWFNDYISASRLEREVNNFKKTIKAQISEVRKAPILHTFDLEVAHDKCNKIFTKILIYLRKKNRRKLKTLNNRYNHIKTLQSTFNK